MKLNYGKTIYSFQIGGDPAGVNTIVQSWLTANGFSLVTNYGETYYYYNDAWYGNRCFQYTIDGNVLTVYAWTIGLGKKFVMLDSGAYNNMAGEAYKQSLNTLFNEINLYYPSNTAQDPNMMQNGYAPQGNAYQAGPIPDSSRFVNTFQNDINDRNEKACNLGFGLAIIGVVLSFLGIAYGVIIYLIEIYCAFMGLKTPQKGKAIATFVLAGVSILIFCIKLVS